MPDDQQQQQTPPINLADPAALTAAYQQYLQYLQQVGNQRPAQAPVISQAQLDANRPTSLLGQLGEALGGGAPSDVPMTADQRERAGVRGLFNFSRGLLGTGTFDSIGQALDRGFTEAERGQYNQEAQVAYGQAAAQDWQRQQMADRLAALKESIPLLQGIQRLNMPSLYGPGGGPGSQAGGGGVPGAPGAPGVATAFTGDKTKDLAMIAQRESGGNPTILNYVARADPSAYARGATASGKYQIVNSTWQEGMKLAGLDPATYATARDAPEAVQDKVAGALYDKYGTRPWDPSKFGANWVQQPGGGYQLVKGAPYTPPPTQVAQQPPATPAQPATAPPAAPGGGQAAALPLPPQPPPGAVPTVTTPEEAKATAAAAGTPVRIPGPDTEALWATPQGNLTSTPRLIMPGTDVASVTPTVPAAPGPQPPPGVVTPAPQQPPAQQPPAQQPPPAKPQTAPVRDLSTLKPTDMTQPEWLQYYRHDPTPDEAARRGIILPANAPEFQQASADLERATQLAAANRAAAQNATNQAQRGLLDQGQVAKLIQASNDADKSEEAARQKVTELLHDTTKTNAAALQKYYDDQDTANRTAYQEQVINPKAAAALAAADVNKSEIGAANSVWQQTVEKANEKAGAARNVRDQLEPAMGLVGAQSTSAFVRNLLQNDPNAATYLKTLGIVDPDKVDATTALRGVLSYISSEMKPTGTGALREYEFNAIQNALSSGSMSLKDQRLAMARILNLQDRVIQEGDATGELWGSAMESGNPRSGLGSIQKNIDARLGPIIHDAVKEMPSAGFDPTDINSVGKWVQSGVVRSGRPVMLPKFNDDGTVMRDRNGNIQTEMQVVK